MVDVELLIKIPEEDWNFVKESDGCRWSKAIIDGVINAKQLPKRHGRLIILSEDAVKREQTPLNFSCQNWISETGLSNATVAIIESDKEEKCENCKHYGEDLHGANCRFCQDMKLLEVNE